MTKGTGGGKTFEADVYTATAKGGQRAKVRSVWAMGWKMTFFCNIVAVRGVFQPKAIP